MSRDDLRIGDAERDDALQKLGEHLAAGRLSIEEHDERSSQIIAARTRGQLQAVFADLPGPHPRLDLSSSAGAPGERSGAPVRVTANNPAARTGPGKAIRSFAADLTPLVWIACLVLMMATSIGPLMILVPIAYSVLLSAWSRASGDPRRGRPPRRDTRRDG